LRRFARFSPAASWWLPYLAGAMAAAAVLGLTVWQVVVRGPLVAVDWSLHELLTPHVPSGAGKGLLDTLSRPGQRWLTLPLLLMVGAWVSWRQRRVRPMLSVLAGLGTAYLVGKTIKDGLARTPPYKDVDILHGIGEAFPSGHAANVAMTWALLSVLLFGARGVWPNGRRLRLGFIVSAGLSVLVGIIMVVMDYHWLSDIPGGWAVGLLALMVALIALGPPQSGEDEGGGYGGQALAAAGHAEPVRGSSTDGDGSADRLREDPLGL
jgi:membrane-associated phospholipid phosphatase